MKNRIFFLVIFGPALLMAGCKQQANQRQRTGPQNSKGAVIQDTGKANTADGHAGAPPVEVLFPEKGERLAAGRSYTLRWNGGPDSLSIFLIDSALESAGASVSISDRIYQQVNTGTYEYSVPDRLEPGTYKFTIGGGASDYFKIVAP